MNDLDAPAVELAPAELAPAGAESATERPAPGELTEAGLEALLFVAERPLSRREIASIAGVDAATVDARLGDLEVSLRDRGIRLLAAGDRIELATAPEVGALVARYVGADAVRLSPAGLETLAIVAYRQPVTRAAVERVRGVDSDHTLRLVVELGRSNTPGRPILYGTAFEFLERFGLESLDDLPPLDADVAARLAEEGGTQVLPLDLDGDLAGEPSDFVSLSAAAVEADPGPEPG
jgi:segregation and condensation protein B